MIMFVVIILNISIFINILMRKKMKLKLLVAAAATVVASSAMAQSAFVGAYGQIGLGYESISPSFSSGTITAGSTRYAYNV
jgi:hypothetical protein